MFTHTVKLCDAWAAHVVASLRLLCSLNITKLANREFACVRVHRTTRYICIDHLIMEGVLVPEFDEEEEEEEDMM